MQPVNRAARCVRLCAFAFCAASPGVAAAEVRAGPYLQALGPTGVEIRVEVDPPAPVEVTVEGAGAPRRLSSPSQSMHVVAVRDLSPRSRYTYGVTAAGARAAGAFVTAPPDSAEEPFTALLYGDNRTDDEAHARVIAQMARAPSDLLLHTGDLVGDARDADEWRSFFRIEAPLLRDRCVFATVGNHDLTDDGDAFHRYFGAVDFSIRWQFARFWFVDAMDDSPAQWLVRDLAAHDGEAGVEWRVVVLHHGPYASGPHGPNRTTTERVVDLWREHKVDLVFAGHDHIYERGMEKGLGYVVSGGGGAPSYRIPALRASSRKAESARHFVELVFGKEQVRLLAHRVDGTLIEERAFHKGRGWDEDVAEAARAKPAPAPAPEAAEAKKETAFGRVALAVLGGGALALLLLALRRHYRRGAP